MSASAKDKDRLARPNRRPSAERRPPPANGRGIQTSTTLARLFSSARPLILLVSWMCVIAAFALCSAIYGATGPILAELKIQLVHANPQTGSVSRRTVGRISSGVFARANC
jgi:hypothetical protein